MSASRIVFVCVTVVLLPAVGQAQATRPSAPRAKPKPPVVKAPGGAAKGGVVDDAKAAPGGDAKAPAAIVAPSEKTSPAARVRVVEAYGGTIRITTDENGRVELFDGVDGTTYAGVRLRQQPGGDLSYTNKKGHHITLHANNDRTVVVPAERMTFREGIGPDGLRHTQAFTIDPPMEVATFPDGSRIERLVPHQFDLKSVMAGRAVELLTLADIAGAKSTLIEVHTPTGPVVTLFRDAKGIEFRRTGARDSRRWVKIEGFGKVDRFYGDIQRFGINSIRMIDDNDHQVVMQRADGSRTRQLLGDATILTPEATLAAREVPEYTIDEDPFGRVIITDHDGRLYDTQSSTDLNRVRVDPQTEALSFTTRDGKQIEIRPDGSRAIVAKQGQGARLETDAGGRLLRRFNPDGKLSHQFHYEKSDGRFVLNEYEDVTGLWKRTGVDAATGKERWVGRGAKGELPPRLVTRIAVVGQNALVVDEGARRTTTVFDGTDVNREWHVLDERGNRQPFDRQQPGADSAKRPTVEVVSVSSGGRPGYSLTTERNAAGSVNRQEFKSKAGLFRRTGDPATFLDAVWQEVDVAGKPKAGTKWAGEIVIDDIGTLIKRSYAPLYGDDGELHAAKTKTGAHGKPVGDAAGNSRRLIRETTYLFTNGASRQEFPGGGFVCRDSEDDAYCVHVGRIGLGTHVDFGVIENDGKPVKTIVGFQEGNRRWNYDAKDKTFKPELTPGGHRRPGTFTHVELDSKTGDIIRTNMLTNSRTIWQSDGCLNFQTPSSNRIHTNSRGQLVRYDQPVHRPGVFEYADDGRLVYAELQLNGHVVVSNDYVPPAHRPLPTANVFRGTDLALRGRDGEKHVRYVDSDGRTTRRWLDTSAEVASSEGQILRVTLPDAFRIVRQGHETADELELDIKTPKEPAGEPRRNDTQEPGKKQKNGKTDGKKQTNENTDAKEKTNTPSGETTPALPSFDIASEILEFGGTGADKFVLYKNSHGQRIKRFPLGARLVHDEKERIVEATDTGNAVLKCRYAEKSPALLEGVDWPRGRLSRDRATGRAAWTTLDREGKESATEAIVDFRIDDGSLVVDFPLSDRRAQAQRDLQTGDWTLLRRDGILVRNDRQDRLIHQSEPGKASLAVWLTYEGEERVPRTIAGSGGKWHRAADPLPGRPGVYEWTHSINPNQKLESAVDMETVVHFGKSSDSQAGELKDEVKATLVTDGKNRLVRSSSRDGKTVLKYDWKGEELAGLTKSVETRDKRRRVTSFTKTSDGKWIGNDGRRYDTLWIDPETHNVWLGAEAGRSLTMIRPDGEESDIRYGRKFELQSQVDRDALGEATRVEDAVHNITRFLRTEDGDIEGIMQGVLLTAKDKKEDAFIFASNSDERIRTTVAIDTAGNQTWSGSNGAVRAVQADGNVTITRADGSQTFLDTRSGKSAYDEESSFTIRHVPAAGHEVQEVVTDSNGNVEVRFRDGKVLRQDAYIEAIESSTENRSTKQAIGRPSESKGVLQVSSGFAEGDVTWLDAESGRVTVFHLDGRKTSLEYLEGLGWYSPQTGEICATAGTLRNWLIERGCPPADRRDLAGDMVRALFLRSLNHGIEALESHGIAPAAEAQGTRTWAFQDGPFPGAQVREIALRNDQQIDIGLSDGRRLSAKPGVLQEWALARAWVEKLVQQKYDRLAVARLINDLSIDRQIEAALKSMARTAPFPDDQEEAGRQAVALIHELATSGELAAMRWLGERYSTGVRVKKDDAEAARWFLKGAEAGDAECQYQMGRRLQQQKKFSEALAWYEKAAGQTHPQAMAAVLRLKAVAGPLESADALEQAWGWVRGTTDAKLIADGAAVIKKLAEEGNTRAMRYLGQMHTQGDGVAYDPQQAVAWLTKAATAGDSEAQFVLGGWYLTGRDDFVRKDLAAARDWLEKAAKQRHEKAAALLSNNFKGPPIPAGLKLSIQEALAAAGKLAVDVDLPPGMLEAARRGDGQAVFEVGQLHREAGKLELAAKWFEWAAKYRNQPAAKKALEQVNKQLAEQSPPK